MPAPAMASVTMSGPPMAPAAAQDSGGEAPTSDVDRLEIEKTDNGGFVVTVYNKPPAQGGEIGNALAFTRPSKHSFGSLDELTGYVSDAFGGSETEAPTEPPAEETPAGEGAGPEEVEPPA